MEIVDKNAGVDEETISEENAGVLNAAESEVENPNYRLALFTADIQGLSNEYTDKDVVLTKALELNRTQENPLSDIEVAELVEEIRSQTLDTEDDIFEKSDLCRLAKNVLLFKDELADPYIFLEGQPFKSPSKYVRNWITSKFLERYKELPETKELNNLLNIMDTLARFKRPMIELKNRVGASEGAFCYDLSDKRFLRVTSEGWKIVPAFPLFRRYHHQQQQVEPLTGGDPWKVFDYLTVTEENKLLVMVYLISLFIPDIAHPVFAVYGDHGSAKSFFCSVINKLADPTLTERVIQPKNERDLIQTLRQKYVTVLDNLSKIDNRVSDILCQVCTGGSISYRQLYTDDGENIARFRHAVILNSINLTIVNADLMDRAIILKLHRIEQKDRKPEHELWEAFNRDRAGILGGIFDTIVKVMKIYPNIKVENLPRLADFAKWGYAIAVALGESGDKFIEDFTQNVKNQNESVAEKNVLCQAVLTLMAERHTYFESVLHAHNALKRVAGLDAKDKTFPKLPHHLRGELDRLRPTLFEHGIGYEFTNRNKNGIKIMLTKAGTSATPATPEAMHPQLSVYMKYSGSGVSGEPGADGIPEVELDRMPEVLNV